MDTDFCAPDLNGSKVMQIPSCRTLSLSLFLSVSCTAERLKQLLNVRNMCVLNVRNMQVLDLQNIQVQVQSGQACLLERLLMIKRFDVGGEKISLKKNFVA